ncbi:MAG: response regulator [Candidatus Dadabacteria bacterium]|nr:MAG: response regulator [Candidatus Dadabacteria bacterium]
MSRFYKVFLFCFVVIIAVVPLFQQPGSFTARVFTRDTLSWINLISWSIVLAFLFAREDLLRNLKKNARDLGIDSRFKSLEKLLADIIDAVSRKNSSFAVNLVERKITSREELSRTFEQIVGLAYGLLKAESAELALFDRETALYHSSFVLGKPFNSSAQAMLAGAAEGESEEPSPEVLIYPISFAGEVLGSLRVALPKGSLPSAADREVLRLLALQGSLAIINANYTEQLVRMKRASEESVKAKTGFLANLSHEIRGPLGIMLNAVELVLDGLCGQINDDQLETLQMVRSNGEHLLDLINDVLDYAKVESGRIVPNPVEIRVDDLLKDIGGVVRSQADAKSHKLVVKNTDEILAICVDKRHIRQMLINLLTNAIKYTPDGGEIELWAERTPGNKIKICVKDTGVGIEESERHKVFSAFERIDHAYSINQMGTGLGMPLTKKLAEVNGGMIDFQSRPGKGSTFWLVFPAAQYDASLARAEEEEQEIEVQGNGEVILLVEKEEGERRMLARYLSHIGFQVIPAAERVEAMDIIRSREINLAIVDNASVDKSENSIVTSIRDKEAGDRIPVVLLSSRAFVFDIEKYLKSGIDRCLIKPVELKKLALACRELIDGNYSGDIIDQEEHRQEKKKKGPVKTRIMSVDDVLH